MTTYKVTGPTAFGDHQPGDEFDADLDADLERRAVERGSITVVKNTKPKKEKESEDV